MELLKQREELNDVELANQLEWLETNGLGGWSGASLTGCNTRRYHGLLAAAVNPPADRMVLVSKMDETIVTDDARYELGVNQYRGETFHPNGYQYLQEFRKGFFPQWVYHAGGVVISKTIAMIHGENTVVILYRLEKAERQISLELRPMMAVRGYHSLMHANDSVCKESGFGSGILRVRLYENTPDIFIQLPGGKFHAGPDWYYNFHYSVEEYRGLDYEEDLFTPGVLSVELSEGASVAIIISDKDVSGRDGFELYKMEMQRRESLLPNDNGKSGVQRILTLAADQFIVKRNGDLKTVIAGYHWFTDWGRDTMISLPGLCIATGRLDDAKRIISAFSQSVSMGMLPNRFQDNGEPPEYNNVDGTLWFFIAVYKYWQASADTKFVVEEILPVLRDIISWHRKGTRFNIHETPDGLLYSGEPGVQLTWMDAKVGDWVVTPRTGKAVEVNALWYNALCIFREFLHLGNQEAEIQEIGVTIDKIEKNFTGSFWFDKGGYLYDVVTESEKDDTLRPNQLFAIGLPFPLISGERAKSILRLVTQKLYTPVGLRTLAKEHSSYVATYGGDTFHRDSSYHQGTVWSWLLGIYADSIMNIYGEEGRTEIQSILDRFSYHLNEGCVGSVSEIFDAEEPHHPRGCVAQAWGVAEILRISRLLT